MTYRSVEKGIRERHKEGRWRFKDWRWTIQEDDVQSLLTSTPDIEKEEEGGDVEYDSDPPSDDSMPGLNFWNQGKHRSSAVSGMGDLAPD
jgi:hypothetical protein